MNPDQAFAPIRRKMNQAGLSELAVSTFRYYYRQLLEGGNGLLGEAQIRPVEQVLRLEDLAGHDPAGFAALAQTVVIKLNGGLGTGMGLNQAKSLLPAREEHNFLDLIADQIMYWRRRSGHAIPLLLMNSFNTDADSLAHLRQRPELAAGQAPLPLSFVQNQVPRLDLHTLQPIVWPAAPQREWCPPGHGDLYTILYASGLLHQLLERGIRYAFVANADNLGASLDVGILGLVAEQGIPFLMEVTERTPADRKGGHLAQDRAGRLILRESAQCPPDEQDLFQDITRYRYFNTNNLWLNLAALADELQHRNGLLGLPMIRNVKHVVPEDPSTPRVIQLESAMGSAIEVFADARILCVPRRRFAPVKTTADLLLLWSDRYRIDQTGCVVSRTDRPLTIDLDPAWFKTIEQFRMRFPAGAPSLMEAESLSVQGDILFEQDVVVRGRVRLSHARPGQRRISAGSVLDNIQEGG